MGGRTGLSKTTALAADSAFAKHANTALPKRAAFTGLKAGLESALDAGLEPYAGAWDNRHASHLLRRTLFGFSRSDLAQALALSAGACVDALLEDPQESLPPPVSTDAKDTGAAVGDTWITAAYDGNFNGLRRRSLQNWWMALILGGKFSLREKMLLFWHNHLATELDAVGDPRYAYLHQLLLRKNVLGNFKDLVRQITVDPAMLQYLNGDSNTNTNPNENYGRELQELFTVGKGPEIAAGNYTNYTEEDVKAAARVLTGWRDVRDTPAAEFQEKKHDAKDKVFSAAYGNTVIAGRSGPDAGSLELDDLIAMIFSQAETARFLCRKLYRYFVYYAIDDSVEADIIAPLADLLIQSGFEVKPVLAALLKSAHFHAAANLGCQIKTPLEMVAGTLRRLELPLPDGSDPLKQYALMAALVGEASRMQQEIGNPPNVAGWPAYYQDPVFYEVWINSDTLPRRVQFTDKLASAKGYGYYTDKSFLSANVLAMALAANEPRTVEALIAELAGDFYPIDLTDKQLNYLKDVMLAGLPDYEWTGEWDAYMAEPADATKIKPVETRLRALFAAMMQMAEFQLC
ncbi:MAG: DUF1800 domain-containing protein [Fibrobacteria bacterium]